jgi:hypothetical protein
MVNHESPCIFGKINDMRLILPDAARLLLKFRSVMRQAARLAGNFNAPEC